jgi:hypothetical protein
MECYGLRRGEMIENADRIMQKRYGIVHRQIAGCMVDDQIVGHVKGYNDVMRAEILRRFGADFFDRIVKEVEDRFYRKHPHAPRE